MTTPWWRIAFATVLIAAAPGPPLQAATLPAPVAEALTRHRIPIAAVSAHVQRIGADAPLVSVNADVARNPASTMKVVTTAAALEILGPTFTWRTEALADGALEGDLLRGNLVLRGGGDPLLTAEDVWRILRALRGRGIRRISGDLVIDNTRFQVADTDSGAFDGQQYRAYNALPDAMLVNFSATDFIVSAWNGGITVTVDPPSAAIRTVNRVRGTGGSCASSRRKLTHAITPDDGGITVEFAGEYPLACGPYTLRRSVLTAPQYSYGLFRALWEEMGGAIDGGLRLATTPVTGLSLHVHDSRTLAEIIGAVNKFSNNVMARQLLLTIGWQVGGAPGTTVLGAAAIAAWLRDQRIDMPHLLVDNGAGLSRRARASAAGLGRLLVHMAASPNAPEFLASLPLAGLDGTMARRLKDSPLRGRARIKTGLLNGVRSMAGYLTSASGETFAVVMLAEHAGIDQGPGTEAQDALLRWVYAQ